VLFYEGVLLMELVLDPHGSPAPRLAEAHVARDVAGALYSDLRGQAIRMLHCDVIHGDLSPYNVLLGRHGAVVIDFPQVVGAAHNSQAESFFQRDLENLRRFFAAIDPSLQASANDAREIWRAYVRRELTPDFVPSGKASRPPQQGPRTPAEPHRSRSHSHEGTAARERARSERNRHTPRTRPPSGREPDRRRAGPAPEVIRVVRPPLAAKGAHAAPPHPSHSATPPAVAGERAADGRSRHRRRRRGWR
jgi:RIO kinase 1